MGALGAERWRAGLLLGVVGAAAAAAALLRPIPQDPAYHRLADGRRLLGLPNALNVVSSLAFVAVGVAGLRVLGRRSPEGALFADARERRPFVLFFGGLALTGLGSAYYHLAPDNARLVWDRLPLAVTVMALLDAVIVERVSRRGGLSLLLPLQALGIGSVLWWYAGEVRQQGDLRLYGLVQFVPMLAVPLMVLLFPGRYTRGGDWLVLVGLYGVARVCEWLDRPIFDAGGLISGHTLKHLVAALAGYWALRMLLRRRPVGEDSMTRGRS
jgi:hypothetical protein